MSFKIDSTLEETAEPVADSSIPQIRVPSGWGIEEDEAFETKKTQLEAGVIGAIKRCIGAWQ